MWRAEPINIRDIIRWSLAKGSPVGAGEKFSVTVRLQNRDGSDVVAAVECRSPAVPTGRGRRPDRVLLAPTDGTGPIFPRNIPQTTVSKAFTDGAGGGTDDSSQGGSGPGIQRGAARERGRAFRSGGSGGQRINSGQNKTSILPQGRTADPVTKLPEKFDLRDIGAVTPVKNQGWIPSCWTFATMSSAESILLRQNNIAEQMGVKASASTVRIRSAGGRADGGFLRGGGGHPNEEEFSGIRWSYAGDLDSIDIRTEAGRSGETAVLFTAKSYGNGCGHGDKYSGRYQVGEQNGHHRAGSADTGRGGQGNRFIAEEGGGLDLGKIKEALSALSPQQALLIPVGEGTAVPKKSLNRSRDRIRRLFCGSG